MAIDRKKIVNPDRFINIDTTIGELRGKTFEEFVDQFEKRIKGWYIDIGIYIGALNHIGFVRMAIDTILIDLLSQYFAGIERGNRNVYKNFLRTHIPEFGIPLQNSGFFFYFYKGKFRKKSTAHYADYADAFWDAFRCGIVHQGRIKYYGRIHGMQKVVDDRKWDSKHNIIEVIVDPEKLLDKVKGVFDQYIRDLKNSSNIDLREKFKRKILYEYGYEIPLF